MTPPKTEHIEQDVALLKQDSAQIKRKTEHIEQEVEKSIQLSTRVEMILEAEISKNIMIIAYGHSEPIRKLN